ncbi:MAG: hypothetical protein JRF63_07900, partial [Deltaproteobacteria bacterium]|nr:hypothetical protein [Deltaproteobacteria bacterium]
PLYCAMYNFTLSTYAPGLSSGDEPGFLLVVSDGQPTCTKLECEDSWDNVFPADMGAITADLAAAGIKTFVIGFDYATADDPAFLEQIAANGDTGYDVIMVDDEIGLIEALQDVAGTVVSCSYEVAVPDDSVDPDLVNFFFEYGDEDQVVPYDEGCADGSGWMWGNPEHTLVVFCEEACAELGGGEVTGVTVEWGCETVEVE